MTSSTEATTFFNAWVNVCDQRREILFRNWPRSSFFTAHVFTSPDCIIRDVARRLSLQYYCGYYCIDAVLFEHVDLVPDSPAGTTWVRRIRIAFEHENDFYSGLFQEVSHLLITDCDLRVVVSYPDTQDALDTELAYLHRIIAGSDRSNYIADTRGFLFIVGWRSIEHGTVEWWGYVYERTQWGRL